MGFRKLIRSIGTITAVAASGLVLAGFDGLTQQTALARSGEPTQQTALAQSEWLIGVSFPKPSGGSSTPERTTGAGHRDGGGSCVSRGQGILPMTALMPLDNVGTTVAANPTLSVYLPRNTAKFAEVVIEDEEFNEVYVKTDISVPAELKEQAGILTLELEGANLEPNKTYTWSFALICNANDRSQDRAIEGLFERQELNADLQAQLEEASPLERAKLYAGAGIWNETLAILAQLRSSNPNEWSELLKSVELQAIETAPFVE